MEASMGLSRADRLDVSPDKEQRALLGGSLVRALGAGAQGRWPCEGTRVTEHSTCHRDRWGPTQAQ